MKKNIKKRRSKTIEKYTKNKKGKNINRVTKKRKFKLLDYSYLKRKPFKHQLEAASFLLDRKRAILADEMGAGKTMSAILAMNSLRGKRLIVCPASLKLNWKKEIEMVSSNNVKIIEGKKWIKPQKDEWIIINYDVLKNHVNEIKKSNFKGVVFDEAHYCKSINNNGYGGSKRARYFIQVSNTIEHVFLLTGTPITNKTKDIFNLLKAMKHPLSKNFKDFAKEYCDPEFNGFGWNYDGSSNQEQLNKHLKPYMLRRLKKDLIELPNKTRTFIPVDVDISKYKQKVKEYMIKRDALGTKNEHLVYLNAMRHILAKEKAKHTIKIAENITQQGNQVVIFTNYTYVVDELCKTFKDAVTITGKDSKRKREEAIEKFQKGKVKMIVCNLISGGVGITLTNANTMLINDLDWNPSNHIQAEERIFRIGQESSVNINYIYSENTIDEKMTMMLEEKLININKIIDNKDEGFLDEVIEWFDKK